MNRVIIAVILLAPFCGKSQTADTENNFSVSGKLKKMKDTADWVYLYYTSANNRITDSAKVQKGKYYFEGNIDEPVLSRLRVKYKSALLDSEQPVNTKRDMATLYLQPGKIKVTNVDSFANIRVKGSPTHKAYKEFELLIRPYNDSMQALSGKYSEFSKAGNALELKQIEDHAEVLQKEIKENVFQYFIKKHPESHVSLLILQQITGQDINVDETEPLYTLLSPNIKAYPSALQLKERIDIAKRTSMGQMAADFTQNDTLGNPVSLSSFKGKYLLVDFWASWCGPCRTENPNVVNAFNKYKDKGFFILGVSLDRSGAKEAWLNAIHDDNLTWTHVSDLQFWNNSVAKLYGIQSIPQNFLLDPTGKIIGKNLRGEDLDRKLEEVLGK